MNAWLLCGSEKKSLTSLTNECSSDMNGIFNYITKTKVKQQRHISELQSFANDVSYFSAELDDIFWILEEYFLNFLCDSQCNSYRHDTF